jgi:hypothetical protein
LENAANNNNEMAQLRLAYYWLDGLVGLPARPKNSAYWVDRLVRHTGQNVQLLRVLFSRHDRLVASAMLCAGPESPVSRGRAMLADLIGRELEAEEAEEKRRAAARTEKRRARRVDRRQTRANVGETSETPLGDVVARVSPIAVAPPVMTRPTEISGKKHDENDADGTCIICFERPYDALLLPCKHLCLCGPCARSLVPCGARRVACPKCRAPVERMVQGVFVG